MKKNRIIALLMIGMLLLISGCSKKMPAEERTKGSFTALEKTESVQVSVETAELQTSETAGESEPPETEETYDSRYFTGEKTAEAEIITIQDGQKDKLEMKADSNVKEAVFEYVSCLYPEEKVCNINTFEIIMDGQKYIMFQVEGNSGQICEVAYNPIEKIYYLFDAEMKKLIPIEYDEYGVRLLG